MPRIETDDFLSDYERAICYFTLPRISYSVNPVMVFFYALVLLVSFSLLLVGFIYENLLIANIGGFLSVTTAGLGIVVFVGRTVINEYKWGKYLKESTTLPNPSGVDLPDPFQDHILLCIPMDKRINNFFPCIDRNGEVFYFIEETEEDRKWTIKNSQDVEIGRMEGTPSLFSFVISYKKPLIINVYEGDNLSYVIKPKWSFSGVIFEISDQKKVKGENIIISDTGIFVSKELVGRFYQLRRYYYLDVQKQFFNLALLAFLIYISK